MASIQNSTWCLVVCGGGGSSVLKPFASNAAALAGGLAVGDQYYLSLVNIYGLPYGAVMVVV